MEENKIRSRFDIEQEMQDLWNLVKKIKSEIVELKKEAMLLCDDKQRFEEKLEEVVVSKRPRRTEKKLVGRIYWKEFFKDESNPNDESKGIWIERNSIVKIDGEWI